MTNAFMYQQGFTANAEELPFTIDGTISLTCFGTDVRDSLVLATDVKSPRFGLAFSTSSVTNLKSCRFSKIEPKGKLGQGFPNTTYFHPSYISQGILNKALKTNSPRSKVLLPSLIAPFNELVMQTTMEGMTQHEEAMEQSEALLRPSSRPLFLVIMIQKRSINPTGAEFAHTLVQHLRSQNWQGQIKDLETTYQSQDHRIAEFHTYTGTFYGPAGN